MKHFIRRIGLKAKQDMGRDEVDRIIVSELQRGASISHSVLTECVSATAAPCWRRIWGTGSPRRAHRDRSPGRTRSRGVRSQCPVQCADAQSRVGRYSRVRGLCPAMGQRLSNASRCQANGTIFLDVVFSGVDDYNHFLMRTLLPHHAVGHASSHFVFLTTKYKTQLPVRLSLRRRA